MSDTDKGDGVICLDSEEDGTPPKKKRTVKEKKLKDSESKPKPKQKTADNKVGREIHSVTRRVASMQKWPDAPSNMCELMTGWPAYNARTLPLPSEDVLQMKLLVNEAYSGTGNGAVSLHHQRRCRSRNNLVTDCSSTTWTFCARPVVPVVVSFFGVHLFGKDANMS